MAEFMVDIKGKINNTPLPDSKFLWAYLSLLLIQYNPLKKPQ